jgi:AMMECR1 domain-containing protein
VILEVAGRSSTFLPVVWEQLPDPAQFLGALCAKQGSPESCWTTAEARFRLYGAEEFGEPAGLSRPPRHRPTPH